jgi:sugar phosphate permease
MFSSIYMAGMLFGSLLGGVIGDSIGRRKSYLLFVGIHTISMYLAAVTSSVIMLIATRALMGFGLGALLVSLFASLAEYVPTSQRGIWMGRNSFIGNCGGANRLSACRGHLSFCYCGDELEVDVFNPGDNVDHHLVVCSALLPGISEVA